jgi:hypothetical protein
MALIARIKHPYIVEFKEAWVEKVRDFLKYSYFCFNNLLRLRYCCGEETSKAFIFIVAVITVVDCNLELCLCSKMKMIGSWS